MIEWIVALGGLAVIFFAAACSLASRCISLHDEIKRLEAVNSELRCSIKRLEAVISELRCSVRALKAENDRFLHRVYEDPSARRISALTLSLRLAQEKIDDLQTKLNKQQVLLKQKWEGSRK